MGRLPSGVSRCTVLPATTLRKLSPTSPSSARHTPAPANVSTTAPATTRISLSPCLLHPGRLLRYLRDHLVAMQQKCQLRLYCALDNGFFNRGGCAIASSRWHRRRFLPGRPLPSHWPEIPATTPRKPPLPTATLPPGSTS